MAKLFPKPKVTGRLFQFLVAVLESEKSEFGLYNVHRV